MCACFVPRTLSLNTQQHGYGYKSLSCTIFHTCICDTLMWDAVLWVKICMLYRIMLRIFSCVNMWGASSFSDCTKSLGRESVSFIMCRTCVNVLRRNSLAGRMPLVFFYSNVCIAIAKSVHSVGITVLHCRKAQQVLLNIPKLTVLKTAVEHEVIAWIGLQMACLDYGLKDGHVQCTNKTLCYTRTGCETVRRPHFSHVCNNWNFGYIHIHNKFLKGI